MASLPESIPIDADEAVLLEGARRGDQRAIEAIVRRYNRRLFRTIRGILPTDADAEDALQDAYVKAFRHVGEFEGRSRFSTWITRIAINAALDHARRLSGAPVQLGLEPSESLLARDASRVVSPPESAMENQELRDILAGAVDLLPPPLRVVFILREVEGLGTRETAECLDLSTANVKVRLHRARRSLQRLIDDHIGRETRQLLQFDGERCDRVAASVLARLAADRDR